MVQKDSAGTDSRYTIVSFSEGGKIRHAARDEELNVEIFASGLAVEGPEDKGDLQCRNYLNTLYPGWEKPGAYWSE